MTTGLRFEDARGYLRVEVSGVHSMQRAHASFAQVAGEVARRGATRVLMDIRALANRVSEVDRYEVARDSAPELRVERLAMLGRPEQVATRFFEDTMRNRGIVTREFDDEAAAIAWLTGD